MQHPDRVHMWTPEQRRIAEAERHGCDAPAMIVLLLALVVLRWL